MSNRNINPKLTTSGNADDLRDENNKLSNVIGIFVTKESTDPTTNKTK